MWREIDIADGRVGVTTVTSSASTRFFELLVRVVLSVTDAGDGQSRLLHIIISDSKPPAPTLFFQVLTTIVSAFKIRGSALLVIPQFSGDCLSRGPGGERS